MAIKVDDLSLVVESYIRNTIRESHPEVDVSAGSVMDDLWVQPLISVLKPLIETINQNELQMDLVNSPFMSDEEIDIKCENNYFITRNEGVKATGSVSFQISDIAKNTTFTIPSGTIVSTASGLKFRTTTNVRLTSAAAAAYYSYTSFVYDIPVPVEAEDVGSEYNVEPGEISVLETGFNNSVRGVNNYQAISGGTDREDSSKYLSRVMDFYTNNFEGCKTGYKNTVYDVRPDVTDLNVQGHRDKFMFRDKGYYYDIDNDEYEGNIGGKVDIYIKGYEPQNYELEMEVTNGLKKLSHLLVEDIAQWNSNKTVVIRESDKPMCNLLFKKIEYNDYSEMSKEEILTQIYSYNVPHTLHSYPQVTYDCIAFADTAIGSGISKIPTGKPYIGIAVGLEGATRPTDASAYQWSRMNEEYGLQMPTRSDGKVRYIWIKYADDVYGTGMTDIAGNKPYIGVAYNKNTMLKSNNYLDYVWYKVSEGIDYGYSSDIDTLEYYYIEVSEDTIANKNMEDKDATLYYFYTTANSNNGETFLNSESFRIATMDAKTPGPIINGMIALENVNEGTVYDVFNYPDRFYHQMSILPEAPKEDKFTFKGTVLEEIYTLFERKALGFNGDTIKWTYSKNATISDIDKYINEENNRVITTDVLVRPAGVKYVNIKIRVKPAKDVVLTDELDDQISKVINDRIYDLALGESLDEATLIADLYAGDYNIRDYIEYIELPFKSIYPVTEDKRNENVIDNKRGDFARDLNDYDVPTVFEDGALPITVNEIQCIQLNKLVIEEIID